VKQTSEPHIFIGTRPGKYAIHDIRKAKQTLDDKLLDFIDFKHQDGSNGRLFYEIALSCPNLHQRNSRESKYTNKTLTTGLIKELIGIHRFIVF